MKRQAPYFLTFCMFLAAVLAGEFGYSQNAIENLIMETYYVSDSNDATDEDGGFLPEGSVTYRVFLDLAPGVKLREIFSAPNGWTIRSSELIWNNEDRGESLGMNIPDNRLDDNTVALDSYITMGAASELHFGIPKNMDPDGSIIGGENNDGGSESIEGGLLINFVPEMEVALTEADGLIEVDESLIPDFSSFILLNEVFFNETNDSVFTSLVNGLQFTEGVSGVTDENILLIAQITTLGEIEFNFNVELELANGNVVEYVGFDPAVDQVLSPFLSFPPECGCTDPDFLEYDPAAPCDDGSCETLIVFGCTDPDACNYDPEANFPETNVFCCYGIDDCNGLDWTVICPTLDLDEYPLSVDFKLYPNPTSQNVWLEMYATVNQPAEVMIYDLQGRLVLRDKLFITHGEQRLQLQLEALPRGTFLVRLLGESIEKSTILVKN